MAQAPLHLHYDFTSDFAQTLKGCIFSLMKRPHTSDAPDGAVVKKRKITHSLKYRQPGVLSALANPQDPNLCNEQLSRALCIALNGAGFDGVRKDAFSSLQGLVEEYMLHFTLRVKQAMQASRRTQAIPHDFIHALKQFNLSPSSLLAELKQPAPTQFTQAPLFLTTAPPTETDFVTSHSSLLGPSEPRRKPHIPKHFPNLPGKHTYMDTSIVTQHELDARKIRERATEEGMLAESALRRLVAAQKAGRDKMSDASRRHDQSTEGRRAENVWRDALQAVLAQDSEIAAGTVENQHEIKMEDPKSANGTYSEVARSRHGFVVNYDRANWRHGANRDLTGAA